MKIIMILMTLFSLKSFAHSEANCEIVNGIYRNSSNVVSDFRFETIADIFSINNANVLTIQLDGQELRFFRASMQVGRNTTMVYQTKTEPVKTAFITLDRTPRSAKLRKEFLGNVIISDNTTNPIALLKSESLIYNFHCKL